MNSTIGWGDRLGFIALGAQEKVMRLIGRNYHSFLWSFSAMKPEGLARMSERQSRRAFFRATKRVPAYRHYVDSHPQGRQGRVPETDKDSYIRAYRVEARCQGGELPMRQTMIDESSGSSGVPYHWVRSQRERRESHRFISYFASYCYGTEPRIVINAFSMGAWATGLNMGQALEANAIVKNTGPDLGKIFSALRFFGPRRKYLLLGYPPFLKHLLDAAEVQGIDLGEYTLDALVGGEGMSEGLRDYLLRRFQRVYSGYGATDLEIGLAGETPLTVAVRRLAWKNPAVKQALFGADSRLPMLFQYNPLMHHIERNEDGELLFTLNRGSVLSPRIRYNVHDEGGVMRFDELTAKLSAAGIELSELLASSSPVLQLPLLWIYGRRDSTVSVMGANIYPEDLEACLYAEPDLARLTRSFCISLTETAAHVRPHFCFELATEPSDELRARFETAMTTRLIELNADFREAWHEYPDTLRPEIQLYPIGQGPFAGDEQRIKQIRVIKP